MIKIDPITNEIIYPSSDGKRMAENTKQYRYITMINGGLDLLYADNENILVVSDLLWYPVEGKPNIATAPDVMVVFGRPKGDRLSYLQWKEENIAPKVVFEILSPSNTPTEMNRKLMFYNTYGVQEYYVYDPDTPDFYGYYRQNGQSLSPIEENMQGFKSPLLGIVFELENGELKIYRPDGYPFLTYLEQGKHALSQYQKRIAEEQAKEEVLKLLEEERKAKEEERRAKEEEKKAKEDALAELEKLRALLNKK
jgi:Uma2 family endonuclease